MKIKLNKFNCQLKDFQRKTRAVLFMLLVLYIMKLLQNYEIFKKHSRYFEYKLSNTTYNIFKLKREVDKLNMKPKVLNSHKFRSRHNTIIIIQVHKGIKRLQHLIFSLSLVKGIQTTTLIFSHSFYDKNINQLIKSINFCKVIQIFYPYSLQLNPRKFPGIDPVDCEVGLDANSRKYCQNRNARLTEHKQHWWWKANFIFSHVYSWTFNYNDSIIFLEEDNIVLPDLLHMLQFTERSLEYFPGVTFVVFGSKTIKHTRYETDLLTLEKWLPSFHIGIAFNRTTWKRIQEYSARFCMFNDYSWSRSLYNLFYQFPGVTSMVYCKTPRVLTTKYYHYDITDLGDYIKLLFPEKVEAVFRFSSTIRNISRRPRPRGGWNDLRDQVLCLGPLTTKSSEEKRYDFYGTEENHENKSIHLDNSITQD